MYDTITVLECLSPLVHTKVWQYEETSQKYVSVEVSRPKYHSFNNVEVVDIEALYELLQVVSTNPQMCVVRGTPRSTVKAEKDVRSHETLYDTDHYWVMFDVDKFELPDGVNHITAPDWFIMNKLPSCFHNSHYIIQESSSARLRGDSKFSCHLWFWFDRVQSNATLKDWAKGEMESMIDIAIFSPFQIHYTAAPIFKNVNDPVTDRIRLVKKETPCVSFSHTIRQIERKIGSGLKVVPETGYIDATTDMIFVEMVNRITKGNINNPVCTATSRIASKYGDMADWTQIDMILRDAINLAGGSADSLQKLTSQINTARNKFGH